MDALEAAVREVSIFLVIPVLDLTALEVNTGIWQYLSEKHYPRSKVQFPCRA